MQHALDEGERGGQGRLRPHRAAAKGEVLLRRYRRLFPEGVRIRRATRSA